MLRRMKVGGRMNLLVAVPMVALVAFIVVGYGVVQRAGVRGDRARSLRVAEELRADTSSPSATLLRAWAEVNATAAAALSPQGFDADHRAAIDAHLTTVAHLRDDFAAAMAHWSAQPLPAEVRAALVDEGGAAGGRFFAGVDDVLRPAIDAADRDAVAAALDGMRADFDAQQRASTAALGWAEVEVVTLQQQADDEVQRVFVFVGGGAALVALLVLLLSVRVRRSVVRPLRALADRATHVARHELPAAVRVVQDLPPGTPTPTLEPFQVSTTRDEVAEVAASFTSVQDAALELAAEQAGMRLVVAHNLVDLARRNQALLGRSLEHIGRLEAEEQDPRRLDQLFRLDHLARRMRRTAESLVVLSGLDPAVDGAGGATLDPPPAGPVPLVEVVRRALAEVENYGQVQIGELGDASLAGPCTPDVVHLLAELLENATTFSSPSEPVTVVGRAVPDGHQLAVFDRGIGLSDDDLALANRRLAEATFFDRERSPMLGLQVVARLAARHGIQVMLTTTPGGTGVTALVRMPGAVLSRAAADQVLARTDLPEASARLTAPLPVVPPVAVVPVRFEPEGEPSPQL